MDLEAIRARCSQPVTEIVASPRDYFRVQQILRDRADLLAEVDKLRGMVRDMSEQAPERLGDPPDCGCAFCTADSYLHSASTNEEKT